MAGEHQQPGRYHVLTSPHRAREPGTGDDPGAFSSDVVAALRYLTEVIDQRLQFGPSGGEQGFAVELGGQGLIFGRHASVLPTPGKAAHRASLLGRFEGPRRG
jgi:hypothetical protein